MKLRKKKFKDVKKETTLEDDILNINSDKKEDILINEEKTENNELDEIIEKLENQEEIYGILEG